MSLENDLALRCSFDLERHLISMQGLKVHNLIRNVLGLVDFLFQLRLAFD